VVIIPYLIAVVVGLAAGWLANIIIQRLPSENLDKPLFGPLHCVRSYERLKWRDVFPVYGYFSQRGVCRYCGKSLPWRFPAVEIGTALSFALAWPLYERQPVAYGFTVFYIFILITVGVIDWQHRLIFPVLLYFASFVAIVAALVTGPHPDNLMPDGIGSSLVGAAFGGVVFYLIYFLALAIYRVRALGFGDVLLAIMIGLVLGFPRAASALFMGSILSGVVALVYLLLRRRKRRDFIPYGTTLCLGVILILMFGDTVWHWGPFLYLTDLLGLLFGIVFKLINQLFGNYV
jgi:leader peptidase (prepilin peptidase)/N-methyltransferase